MLLNVVVVFRVKKVPLGECDMYFICLWDSRVRSVKFAAQITQRLRFDAFEGLGLCIQEVKDISTPIFEILLHGMRLAPNSWTCT